MKLVRLMNIINYTTREKMDANDYMFGERNGEIHLTKT